MQASACSREARCTFSKALTESIGPMWIQPKGLDRCAASRWPAPEQAKERGGRTTPCSSVRDEFRPAIPRSGCSPALPVSAFTGDSSIKCWRARRQRFIIER